MYRILNLIWYTFCNPFEEKILHILLVHDTKSVFTIKTSSELHVLLVSRSQVKHKYMYITIMGYIPSMWKIYTCTVQWRGLATFSMESRFFFLQVSDSFTAHYSKGILTNERWQIVMDRKFLNITAWIRMPSCRILNCYYFLLWNRIFIGTYMIFYVEYIFYLHHKSFSLYIRQHYDSSKITCTCLPDKFYSHQCEKHRILYWNNMKTIKAYLKLLWFENVLFQGKQLTEE